MDVEVKPTSNLARSDNFKVALILIGYSYTIYLRGGGGNTLFRLEDLKFFLFHLWRREHVLVATDLMVDIIVFPCCTDHYCTRPGFARN